MDSQSATAKAAGCRSRNARRGLEISGRVCGKAFIAHVAGCRSNGLKPPYFVDSPWKSGPALHISG